MFTYMKSEEVMVTIMIYSAEGREDLFIYTSYTQELYIINIRRREGGKGVGGVGQKLSSKSFIK